MQFLTYTVQIILLLLFYTIHMWEAKLQKNTTWIKYFFQKHFLNFL